MGEEDREGSESRSGKRRRRSGCHLALGLLALATAIWVGSAVFARTRRAQDLATAWLVRQTGYSLVVERVRIGWPYALVLGPVRSNDYEPQRQGFRAAEIRFGWRGGACWSLTIRDAELNLRRTAEGEWQPAPVARLGGLPAESLKEVSRLTVSFRSRVRLLVRNGELRWFEDGDRPVAAARGIDFEVLPVRMPGRDWFYHALAVQCWWDPTGRRYHDIRRVWLASPDRPYVEIERAGPSMPEDPTGFWASPQPPAAEER